VFENRTLASCLGAGSVQSRAVSVQFRCSLDPASVLTWRHSVQNQTVFLNMLLSFFSFRMKDLGILGA
jgi:hypothetical protein